MFARRYKIAASAPRSNLVTPQRFLPGQTHNFTPFESQDTLVAARIRELSMIGPEIERFGNDGLCFAFLVSECLRQASEEPSGRRIFEETAPSISRLLVCEHHTPAMQVRWPTVGKPWEIGQRGVVEFSGRHLPSFRDRIYQVLHRAPSESPLLTASLGLISVCEPMLLRLADDSSLSPQ